MQKRGEEPARERPPDSRAGTQTCPPSLSISGQESLGLDARCAYSLLRVPGMSQWCRSQLHDSTALASLPPLGGGTRRGEGEVMGDGVGWILATVQTR